MTKIQEENCARSNRLEIPCLTSKLIANELEFLAKIDKRGEEFYYNDAWIRNAIRRYETCWIPFIKAKCAGDSSKDMDYAPPLGESDTMLCHPFSQRRHIKHSRRALGLALSHAIANPVQGRFGEQIRARTNHSPCAKAQQGYGDSEKSNASFVEGHVPHGTVQIGADHRLCRLPP